MQSNPDTPFAFTSTTSSLASGKEENGSFSSNPGSLVANPFESLCVLNAAPPMNGGQFYPGSSLAQCHLCPSQRENTSDCTSSQDTSKVADLLDTRQWSLSATHAASYTTSGSHFPSTFTTRSHTSLDEPFGPHGTQARGTAPGPQLASPHSQVIPDHYLSPAYQPLSTHQPDYRALATSSVVPLPSTGSTEHIETLVRNVPGPPLLIYRAPQNGSGRRHSRRACAIYIEGMWIDKDDIYTGARQSGGIIEVHECRWADSGNPCGMWIMVSRSRASVGSHIRKWHPHSCANGTVKCLWDGCTASKAMLKDSISRHIVTVHLGETFLCQGCNQEFSRKDVYDKHAEGGGMCRDAGAVIAYGTERRVIDTRQALQRGFNENTIHYSC